MSRLLYIVAHRGLSAAYPENTMSALQAAVALGVDWIKLDVVTTPDNVVIVSHDSKADRCTNTSGLFKMMTLDAGSRFDPKFAGERIPTLNEVISLIEKTLVRLCIEIKGDTSEEFQSTARWWRCCANEITYRLRLFRHSTRTVYAVYVPGNR